MSFWQIVFANPIALLCYGILLIMLLAGVNSYFQEKRDATFPDLLFAKMMLLGLPYSVTVQQAKGPGGEVLIHVELYPDPDDADWDSPAAIWDGSNSPADMVALRAWIRDTAVELWGETL